MNLARVDVAKPQRKAKKNIVTVKSGADGAALVAMMKKRGVLKGK